MLTSLVELGTFCTGIFSGSTIDTAFAAFGLWLGFGATGAAGLAGGASTTGAGRGAADCTGGSSLPGGGDVGLWTAAYTSCRSVTAAAVSVCDLGATAGAAHACDLGATIGLGFGFGLGAGGGATDVPKGGEILLLSLAGGGGFGLRGAISGLGGAGGGGAEATVLLSVGIGGNSLMAFLFAGLGDALRAFGLGGTGGPPSATWNEKPMNKHSNTQGKLNYTLVQ